MRPGHERRIDPLDFTVHRLNDGVGRTGKLREREGDEMARPPVVHAVTDQLGVANHELPVDGIDTADPIVIVYSRIVFDRLIRLIEFVLLEFVPVGFGWIGYV
jgi:hypothetical protein